MFYSTDLQSKNENVVCSYHDLTDIVLTKKLVNEKCVVSLRNCISKSSHNESFCKPCLNQQQSIRHEVCKELFQYSYLHKHLSHFQFLKKLTVKH